MDRLPSGVVAELQGGWTWRKLAVERARAACCLGRALHQWQCPVRGSAAKQRWTDRACRDVCFDLIDWLIALGDKHAHHRALRPCQRVSTLALALGFTTTVVPTECTVR